MNAKLTRLTSLGVFSRNCLLPLSLNRLPKLRSLTFAIPLPISTTSSTMKDWLVSTFSSSSSHLENIRCSELFCPPNYAQVLYDVYSSLPSLMTIDGQASDAWLRQTKEDISKIEQIQ
jgi:hypothetical protein